MAEIAMVQLLQQTDCCIIQTYDPNGNKPELKFRSTLELHERVAKLNIYEIIAWACILLNPE